MKLSYVDLYIKYKSYIYLNHMLFKIYLKLKWLTTIKIMIFIN